jgi:hypothetical protein
MERMKVGVTVGWVFAIILVATLVNLTWATGSIFGLLAIVPPIALFILWHEPGPSMSERINAARR